MYTFQVENMSCSHCVRAVTEAVQTRDPNARVTVDLGSKQVTVESSSAPELLSHAIAEAGFPVSAAR